MTHEQPSFTFVFLNAIAVRWRGLSVRAAAEIRVSQNVYAFRLSYPVPLGAWTGVVPERGRALKLITKASLAIVFSKQ